MNEKWTGAEDVRRPLQQLIMGRGELTTGRCSFASRGGPRGGASRRRRSTTSRRSRGGSKEGAGTPGCSGARCCCQSPQRSGYSGQTRRAAYSRGTQGTRKLDSSAVTQPADQCGRYFSQHGDGERARPHDERVQEACIWLGRAVRQRPEQRVRTLDIYALYYIASTQYYCLNTHYC